MAFIKTVKQIEATELMASDARHIMLFGGGRSGKTASIVRNIIIRANLAKSRHISLRTTFNSIKTSIWMDTIPKVMALAFPTLHVEYNRSDYVMTFPNGSEYWIAGLDSKERVEKILGKEFSTLHFNEVSMMDYSSIQVALTRLAEKSDLRKKVYYDMNPPKKSHWSYKVFMSKINPLDNVPLPNPTDYASILMNPKDNIANLDEDYLKLLESMPEEQRNRFLLGLFQEDSDGQAYYAFTMDKHCRPDVKMGSGSLFIGMDFNVNPFTAVICQVVNRELHVIDEVFLNDSDTYKMSAELIKRGYRGTIIPDSTGKNRKTSGKSDFDILKEHGFKIDSVRNPYVRDRVNNINRLLTSNSIAINSKCVKTINDLESVKWKNGNLDEGNDKMLTHISDALGYVAWRLFPISSISNGIQITSR